MVNGLKLPPDSTTPSETVAKTDELARLKFQFLASLNHEIRTPLTGILGMADLLLETELTGEQIEYINAAKSCAENLFEILNATLDFTALSAGNLVLEHAEFHFLEAFRTVFEQYRAEGESKGLTMRLLLDKALPEYAVGDSIRLQQLIGYLLSNAVKFTHFGSVTLEASADKDETGNPVLSVCVTDTGIGIPRESLAAAFESFRQLESGLSRGYQGLGLGLALAQKLASIMGGAIGAESTPGEGSRFWFSIPLQFTDIPAPSKAESTHPDDYRVLVVEDNDVAQDIVRHVLKRRPYAVDFVASGELALEAARCLRYDLILMDLQMQGMDGFEATQKLRGLPGYGDVAVLAFTANASTEYRSLCRQKGMQGFLSKPIDAAEMLKTLDGFLPQIN